MALCTPHRGVYKVADQFGSRLVPQKVRQNRLNDAQQILTVLRNRLKKPARGPIAQKWSNLRHHGLLNRSAATICLSSLGDQIPQACPKFG